MHWYRLIIAKTRVWKERKTIKQKRIRILEIIKKLTKETQINIKEDEKGTVITRCAEIIVDKEGKTYINFSFEII